MKSETVLVKPTEIEKEIVQMLANGERGDRIAAKVGMSVAVFSSRLAAIRMKYDCENSTHLVAIFLRKRFIK